MDAKTLTIHEAEGLTPGGAPGGESYQRYSLTTGGVLGLTEGEAREDKSWHIGVKRSVICANGGEAGPGGITGCVINSPDDSPRDVFLRKTDEDWRRMFEEVESIPGDAPLMPEGIAPAIVDWRVMEGGKWSRPVGKSWKLRLADGKGFAKMRVRQVDAADGETITVQFAVQPDSDAPLGPDREAVVRPGESFSFIEGRAVTPAGTNWDIRHGGGKVYLNSSVSGPGAAGAIGSNRYGAQWSRITSASDSVAYFMDEYGEIFRSPRWYRYNLEGDHRIHPNGAVYGLRTADGDFKVQVFYYDIFKKAAGAGQMKIRYARL